MKLLLLLAHPYSQREVTCVTVFLYFRQFWTTEANFEISNLGWEEKAFFSFLSFELNPF